MEWIQPAFFWGLLGISIPLAIHLWNGRKGKVIAWAATAWLNTKQSQSNRSLKLEHWWLLLVRIILWTLLVLLAVGLWWKSLDQSGAPRIAHVVIPNPEIEAEYRFELEQAISRGEAVFWLTEGLPSYEAGENSTLDFEAGKIQDYLALLPEGLDSLHFYAAGLQSEFPSSTIWVSRFPKIHIAKEAVVPRSSDRLLQLPSGGFLGLDESGHLTNVSAEASSGSDKIAFSGVIPVYVSVRDETKKEQLMASLAALEEVYGLSFDEVDFPVAEVVFADEMLETETSEKLSFVTEATPQTTGTDALHLDRNVSMPWEEAVDKGILPELILAPLIEFFGISQTDLRLSQNQVAQKFVEIPQANRTLSANTTEILLIVIALCFILERFLAYRSNL